MLVVNIDRGIIAEATPKRNIVLNGKKEVE